MAHEINVTFLFSGPTRLTTISTHSFTIYSRQITGDGFMSGYLTKQLGMENFTPLTNISGD